MLVTSIFFFSHNVFNRLPSRGVIKSSDCVVKGKPITRRQILDSSKLKELADDNFKFDENGRKWVENTVGKGEIARYEGNNSKFRQARVMIPSHCTPPR